MVAVVAGVIESESLSFVGSSPQAWKGGAYSYRTTVATNYDEAVFSLAGPTLQATEDHAPVTDVIGPAERPVIAWSERWKWTIKRALRKARHANVATPLEAVLTTQTTAFT